MHHYTSKAPTFLVFLLNIFALVASSSLRGHSSTGILYEMELLPGGIPSLPANHTLRQNDLGYILHCLDGDHACHDRLLTENCGCRGMSYIGSSSTCGPPCYHFANNPSYNPSAGEENTEDEIPDLHLPDLQLPVFP